MLEFKAHRFITIKDVFSGAVTKGIYNTIRSAKQLAKENQGSTLWFIFDMVRCRVLYEAYREADYVYYQLFKYRGGYDATM